MAKLANDQQELYCNEYLIDRNQTQAAIRAKYKCPKQYASELMKRQDILERIAELDEERAERTLLTQDMVITGLLNEAKCEGEGSSHSARVSAWAHLGKHLGMFKEKLELDVADPVAELLKQISGNTLKPKG